MDATIVAGKPVAEQACVLAGSVHAWPIRSRVIASSLATAEKDACCLACLLSAQVYSLVLFESRSHRIACGVAFEIPGTDYPDYHSIGQRGRRSSQARRLTAAGAQGMGGVACVLADAGRPHGGWPFLAQSRQSCARWTGLHSSAGVGPKVTALVHVS